MISRLGVERSQSLEEKGKSLVDKKWTKPDDGRTAMNTKRMGCGNDGTPAISGSGATHGASSNAAMGGMMWDNHPNPTPMIMPS